MSTAGHNLYQTPVFLKGYHPVHNSTGDYKVAKAPVYTGFTKADYKPPTADECKQWEAAGGWIGHLVPQGSHVIDCEVPERISNIKGICMRHGISPPINRTNNGIQFVFSVNGVELGGQSNILTRSGVPVTYRAAGKNYVILPPTNGRSWENEGQLDNPPQMPDELYPAQNTIDDSVRTLAWAMGEAFRKEVLAGYDDMDACLMALFLSCEIPERLIQEAFALVFLNNYDTQRTNVMYQRTRERREKGEPLLGVGSLVKSLKDKGLEAIAGYITKLQRLAGTSSQAQTSDDTDAKEKHTKTEKIIRLALAEAELFHDADMKAYATIKNDGHRETYSLRSKKFRTWLSGRLWKKSREGCGGQIVQDALGTIEAHAIHDGSCHPVYVRLALC